MTLPDASFDIRLALTIGDYLYVRRLRNRVRHQMTNDTARVGYWRQLRFYLTNPANVQLYIARVDGRRAGYLLLRRHANTCFITEAVDEPFRRAGVAANMVRFAQRCCDDLTADILHTNTASVALHERMRFRLVGSDGRVATYRFHEPR